MSVDGKRREAEAAPVGEGAFCAASARRPSARVIEAILDK